MLAKILKETFDGTFNAPIEVWTEFAHFCESVSFKKDEIIKHYNTDERYFYFLSSLVKTMHFSARL